MNYIDKHAEVYFEIDEQFSKEEFLARIKGYSRKTQKLRDKRIINDQSYFLFLFTRLEKLVKEKAQSVIDHKTGLSHSYHAQRIWKIVRSDIRLNLMHMVSFFLDPGLSDYQTFYENKKRRDKIAHGGLDRDLIMRDAIIELSKLYSLIKSKR